MSEENTVWHFEISQIEGDGHAGEHGAVHKNVMMEIRENTVLHESDAEEELKTIEGQFSGNWYCGGILDLATGHGDTHPHILVVRKDPAPDRNFEGKIIDLNLVWEAADASAHNKTFHNP